MSSHRISAKINLKALAHNYREIIKHISDSTKVMAIVKADGYGHGAVKVAQTLAEEGANYFGVATVEEGIELRLAGIEHKILVLGYTPIESFQILIEYNLMPTVFSLETAKMLQEAAISLNQRIQIHIKVDTGMSRLGFKDDQKSLMEICEISQLSAIDIEGIFTHFSCSDMADQTYTLNQLGRFNDFCEQLKHAGCHIPIRHSSNSGAVISYPQAHMDLVRPGIMLYGLYPSDEVDKNNVKLQAVMELKSHVVYIKELEAGVCVGYGATYKTSKRTKIATIPVGYGDGYPRSLSNLGAVLIRGQRAPIIGRVCMDQLMVDVTQIEGVQLDDVVTLIGKNGTEQISVEEMANLAGSFNYEFVCRVTKRVPRVYE